jgi:hypothetical protein
MHSRLLNRLESKPNNNIQHDPTIYNNKQQKKLILSLMLVAQVLGQMEGRHPHQPSRPWPGQTDPEKICDQSIMFGILITYVYNCMYT